MNPANPPADPEILNIEGQTVFIASSETMPFLSRNSFDLIVTSPPYNRGKTYRSDQNDAHDDRMPENSYFAFLGRVWAECFKVAAPHGVFFLNIGDAAADQGLSERVAQAAENAGWHRIQDIVWVKSIYGKGHYTPSGGSRRFNNVWEHIYLFAKDPKRYRLDPKAVGIPYADKSNIGRYSSSDLRDPGNVFHICYEKTTGATVKKGHDAPFPIGLPYRCIQAVPNARTVLDPFLGTGTTLAACARLGLHGFGVEKYPQRDLIQATILEGKSYEPEPVVLLPHFEESVRLLAALLEAGKECPKEFASKRERQRWEIVFDTLEKLDAAPRLRQTIQAALLRSDLQNTP